MIYIFVSDIGPSGDDSLGDELKVDKNYTLLSFLKDLQFFCSFICQPISAEMQSFVFFCFFLYVISRVAVVLLVKNYFSC